ncbi:hypothetical protein BJX96DRAFT_104414 [Aspergillus floccosus]
MKCNQFFSSSLTHCGEEKEIRTFNYMQEHSQVIKVVDHRTFWSFCSLSRSVVEEAVVSTHSYGVGLLLFATSHRGYPDRVVRPSPPVLPASTEPDTGYAQRPVPSSHPPSPVFRILALLSHQPLAASHPLAARRASDLVERQGGGRPSAGQDLE